MMTRFASPPSWTSRDRAHDVAAAHGADVAAFTSLTDLLAARDRGEVHIDGAIVATSGSHVPDSEALLDAGIAVLAEKPLGITRAAVSRLAARPDAADRLRIGYMKEYDPAVRAAKVALDGVAIRAVELEVLHPADEAQLAFANLPSPPADVDPERLAALMAADDAEVSLAVGHDHPTLRKLYAGVMMGSVIHEIALLRVLLGGIGSVDHARHWGPEFPGSLDLSGVLSDGATPWRLGWHFIPDYPQYRETVRVHHAHGSIALAFDVPYLLNVATTLTETSRVAPLGVSEQAWTWPQQEAFETELLEFAALCRGNPQPGSSAAGALADTEVAQRMIAALARAGEEELARDCEARIT